MTLPMARDLGKYGVRVMTLAPGVWNLYYLRYFKHLWVLIYQKKF